jgi:hypothetical protein
MISCKDEESPTISEIISALVWSFFGAIVVIVPIGNAVFQLIK